MDGKAVSVIVPVFNSGGYLPRCIESIQGQTMGDLEILLIDDGSEDDSGKICDRYAQADPRIRVLHKRNEGLVRARQDGIKMSQGKYILFVDSDDWIESGMLESLYGKAIEVGADVVVEGMKEDVYGIIRERKNLIAEGVYSSKKEREYFLSHMLNFEDFFCVGIQPYLWNKLLKRELVMGHMQYINANIRIGEDAAAVYPMLATEGTKVVSGECHYHYCIRGDSMMSAFGDTREEYDNIVLLNKVLKESFEKVGVWMKTEKQLKRYTVCNVLTRAYSIAAECSSEGLFPFQDILPGQSIIVYGAGAFGRAVYSYISVQKRWKLKAWVDADTERYCGLGMPVQTLEETNISAEDVILIAILRKRIKEAVERYLYIQGVKSEQIRWIERLDV